MEGIILHIAVCLKVVPDTKIQLNLDPFTNRLDPLSLFDEINPHDWVAVHEALKLKAQTGGRVTVYHAGSASAEALLRRVLLAGVDAANLISPLPHTSFSRSDLKIALSEQFKSDRPDVIFCGAESTDEMHGDFPALLANELKCVFVSQVMRVVRVIGEQTSIEAERRVAPGWAQRVRCRMPLVLSMVAYSPADAARLELPLLPERIDEKVQIKYWRRSHPSVSASGIWEHPIRTSRLRRARHRFRPTPTPDASSPAADRISDLFSSQALRKGGITATGTAEESVDLLLNLLDQLDWPFAIKSD